MGKVEKGQSLVEFSVSLVLLLLLLSGIAEFGVMFFQYVQLRDAAQEGALYGSMYPVDTVSIEQRVRGASNSPINLTSPQVQVIISYEKNTKCEKDGIQVTVQYPHKVFMPFMSRILGQSIMLRGQVTDTILQPICQ